MKRVVASLVALACGAVTTAGCGARTSTPATRAASAANRPPSVRASCEPCRVEFGQLSTVIVDATDPDDDPLTYRWSTAAGTLATPTEGRSSWTAPMQQGAVPVIVEVRDSKGGVATDAVTIQVVQPADSGGR